MWNPEVVGALVDYPDKSWAFRFWSRTFQFLTRCSTGKLWSSRKWVVSYYDPSPRLFFPPQYWIKMISIAVSYYSV